MITFPNAKINLGLSVIARRSDGFHELETGMYPIPLRDVLELVPSEQGTSLETSGLDISGNRDSNLVYRAWKLLHERHAVPDVRIHLHKRIELGAGLGGGSSNGAYTLKILNELFDLHLSNDTLKEYAGMLGSDCPFFIDNKPVLASGKGERLNPLTLDLSGTALLLIFPGIHIRTEEAYRWISPQKKPRPLSELIKADPEHWQKLLVNDFEEVVFARHPKLAGIKRTLLRSGAFYASMSGSGSTLYGLFSTIEKIPGPEAFQDCRIWKGVL